MTQLRMFLYRTRSFPTAWKSDIRKYSDLGRDKYKVLFFGTDDFSVATLNALNKGRLDHHGCVSKLDICCLKMNHLTTKVVHYAHDNDLQIHFWPPDEVTKAQFDVGVVSSFGKLIPKRVIDLFPRGVLNVHASLLPRWRGASPIAHALMHGDLQTGISIMKIEPERFDIGRILAQEPHPIATDITRYHLCQELSEVGANLMLKVLSKLEDYSESSWEQDESKVTYAPRINPSMFDLKWNEWSADQVWNRYRGLTDFGKLQSVWLDTNELVRFQDMRHPNDLFKFKLENESSPGKTVFVRDRRDLFMCIKCREGWVSFKNFYYGKRKVMSTRDFYNGFFSKYKKTSKSLYFGSQSPDKNKET